MWAPCVKQALGAGKDRVKRGISVMGVLIETRGENRLDYSMSNLEGR